MLSEYGSKLAADANEINKTTLADIAEGDVNNGTTAGVNIKSPSGITTTTHVRGTLPISYYYF